MKKQTWGEVLRWQRNRMGKPLSPPQIHQQIIWTMSKFHKTNSECWRRTPGTQKGGSFSSKGDVLSSVLYGWRSLQATVRIRLKARGRRLTSKTRTPQNSWLQGTLIDKSSSKSLHYLHWNQAPPKSQQVPEQDIPSRKITLSIKTQAAQSHIKPLDISKLTTGHFIVLQREEIQFHPPEHWYKLP